MRHLLHVARAAAAATVLSLGAAEAPPAPAAAQDAPARQATPVAQVQPASEASQASQASQSTQPVVQQVASSAAGGWWAQVLRPADMWSGPTAGAESFGQLPRGQHVFVPDSQPFPESGRVYVQEAAERAYGYVDAIALAPSGPPSTDPGATSQPSVVGSPLFRPFWIANHAPATLWDSPNDGAQALLELAPFSKMLVLAPAAGARYYVQDGRTDRLGYVESTLIGPSDPPVPNEFAPPPSLTPPPAPSYRPTWVAARRAADLWSGMTGGTSFGRVATGEHLLVMAPPDGPRLHVLNPKTRNFAFVDTAAVGPSEGPKAAAIEVKGWRGAVTGDVVNLRPEPNTYVPHVAQARLGDEITVAAWVEGEELDKDNRTWARVTSITRKDAFGRPVELLTGEFASKPPFIYSGLVRPLAAGRTPEPPRTALGNGGARWIDVNLTEQVVVAYEGDKAVFSAPTTSGRPGWETPVGTFRIQRRVENETMVGSTLLRLDTHEIPDYRLENVKWTQYFTGGGAALHTNYWRPAGLFGMPSSHGCLGLLEHHAKWLWDWARVGTPLVIHY
jgi:lipoprotein-anchoring transpeptidase ErfK/SrfK